jgi:hypothetical protein
MLKKQQSHGKIGEAAVTAKCWMNGIAAYNTGGLRSNFAGSDLLLDTSDPKKKLLIQVKAGYSPGDDQVYLTQCSGEEELEREKFVADFVVFVNIDRKVGPNHQHDGTLSFEHLSYFVVPRDVANNVYGQALRREHSRPLRNGGQRKLGNLAVIVPLSDLKEFKDAWHLMRRAYTANK